MRKRSHLYAMGIKAAHRAATISKTANVMPSRVARSVSLRLCVFAVNGPSPTHQRGVGIRDGRYFSGEKGAGMQRAFDCFTRMSATFDLGGQMPLATASARMRERSPASLYAQMCTY